MIEAIHRIKGLGVYADYKPAQGMAPFAMKNIVYGWNYSGKTTLSRIFAMLERKAPIPDMPAFEFEFKTDKGAVDHSNYQQTDLQVRVFNVDFVNANLNFVGSHFNPIFLLGEESKAAIDRIARCDKALARIAPMELALTMRDDRDTEALSSARTAAAAAIREALSLTTPFRADHLEKEVVAVKADPSAATLSADDLQASLRLARSSDQDRLPNAPATSMETPLRRLREEAQPVLTNSPGLANTIAALLSRPEIERWVQDGLRLHEHADGCAFCGSPLSEDRLAELRAHFTKDMAIHAQAIAALVQKVERSRLSFAPRAAAELYAPFRERYAEAAAELSKAIGLYNGHVDALLGELAVKAESPRTARELPACEDSAWIDVAHALDALNRIVGENNNVSDNFDQSKANAIKKLKAHYAAEFVATQKLDALDEARKARAARRGQLHRWRNMLKAEVAKQRAVINKAQRGREEINARLESLLGPASVRIDVVDVAGEERFRLARRDGRAALHLSEGEKTAVAFAYFLTKVKELPDLSQAIVCIDDPISSLDSNHVFQVVAAIRQAFFEQAPKDEGGGWRTRCKQIFILTHNFNFFALLRELRPDKTAKTKARHYLVKRRSATESSIVDMPHALLHYSSEYHFLFGVLDKFRKARGDDEMELLLMLPNAMRRFVELYTYSRMPTNDDVQVDARAEVLFGPEAAKRILKTLHYFSHANNIERMAENSDLICDIEAAIDAMLSHIEREDPIHWRALRSAHPQTAA